MVQKKYIFHYRRAPGDVLMLTALVRDLKLTYGDDILIDVEAPYPTIWENNPYLTELGPRDRDVVAINFDRGPKAADRRGLKRSQTGEGLHYCTAFHKCFTERTQIPVECLFSKADLHLTEEEKQNPPLPGRYWVIVPAYKTDITNKAWHPSNWQKVVDGINEMGAYCLQEGTDKRSHVNPPLQNVTSVVGKNDIRGLIRHILHAEGVVSGVSLPMHLAGALEKPCVVLMGGREEPTYEHYTGRFSPSAEPVRVPHVMLHTIGQLDCCKKRGCWLRRVVKLNDNRTAFNQSLCKLPDLADKEFPVATCMSMITSDNVLDGVKSYYLSGALPSLN